MRIRHDILDNAIPARGVGIGEAVVQRAFFRIFEFVFEIAAFLMAKGLAVSDEKLEIAGVRTINIRIIDFVDDAVAESEPDAAASMICSADTFFGAASLARLDSRRAKSR